MMKITLRLIRPLIKKLLSQRRMKIRNKDNRHRESQKAKFRMKGMMTMMSIWKIKCMIILRNSLRNMKAMPIMTIYSKMMKNDLRENNQ